jgi:hypothetical protein
VVFLHTLPISIIPDEKHKTVAIAEGDRQEDFQEVVFDEEDFQVSEVLVADEVLATRNLIDFLEIL